MKKIKFNRMIASIRKNIKIFITFIFLVLSPLATQAEGPDCAGIDRWPTKMTFVHLKNAGLTDNNRLDFTKTKTISLASEKIGKDLYRQVHYIIFTEKSGNKIETITINNVSSEECSMSDVDIYIVSRHLVNK